MPVGFPHPSLDQAAACGRARRRCAVAPPRHQEGRRENAGPQLVPHEHCGCVEHVHRHERIADGPKKLEEAVGTQAGKVAERAPRAAPIEIISLLKERDDLLGHGVRAMCVGAMNEVVSDLRRKAVTSPGKQPDTPDTCQASSPTGGLTPIFGRIIGRAKGSQSKRQFPKHSRASCADSSLPCACTHSLERLCHLLSAVERFEDGEGQVQVIVCGKFKACVMEHSPVFAGF